MLDRITFIHVDPETQCSSCWFDGKLFGCDGCNYGFCEDCLTVVTQGVQLCPGCAAPGICDGRV